MSEENLFKGEEGLLFLEELITKIKNQEADKWCYTSRINEEQIKFEPCKPKQSQSNKVISFNPSRPTLGFGESTIFERPRYYYSNHQEIYKTKIDLLDVILENVKEYNKWGDTLEKDTYSLVVMTGEQLGNTHGNKIKELFNLVKQKVNEYKKKQEETSVEEF